MSPDCQTCANRYHGADGVDYCRPANTSATASPTGADATATTLPTQSGAKPRSGSRKPPKAKTCRACGNKFEPMRSTQVICFSLHCAITHTSNLKAKRAATEALKAARAHREAKVKAKTRQQWMKEAQASFNRWVRLRDRLEPCISCGRQHQGQWHAGHFRSTKAAPELRFEELNIWKQCQPCNTHLSGNILEYRKSLVAKIGLERVEWLEGKHEPKHYSIDDLREIKARYTAMAKAIDNSK